ncbi:LysR family transcriptional regulator [Polymorphobacter sp. PAMC 29334]|uniref:LysR family transcriptional regulator n=1 Tax=Polymorphobacter sp. PAMC 29334 TaxID=2862331 RepID=UPI001C67ACC9|nr:LysR family transcriptional regulator [Polymorphobacter sp. PAMC 29334]QYE36351.1 LysR family transcriptional regulator [Polymorphobacter sp. PAMC 29334]
MATDYDDVKFFLAVAEAGSLSQAAHRLSTSKSVVSRRIARLEEEVGSRLLTRSARGVILTEAGHALRQRAGPAFEELDGALLDAARSRQELTGLLRITAPIAFGTNHLAPLLTEFMRANPKLRLDLSLGDRRVDILAEGFDVAVRMGALPDSTLVARRIAPLRLAVLASPEYLARRGVPARPRDLVDHDCIVYTVPNGDIWRFRDGARFTSVRITGRFRSDSPEAMRVAALAGHGIAGLPTYMLGSAIEDGALIPLLTAYPVAEAGLYAVRPPGPPVAKTRAFIDALVARFGPEPSWNPDHALKSGDGV